MRKIVIYGFLISFLLVLADVAAAASGAIPNKAPQEACVIRVESDSNPYPKALLEMALAKTESKFGVCRVETKSGLSHARLEAQVQESKIDVGWFNTTKAREQMMSPVQIPLHQGLGGYRILIIRKSDLEKFANVRDLPSLRKMRAGRVDDDLTKIIFGHNQLLADYSGAHDQLFDMLANNRVDYLPRAIYKAEIDAEKIRSMPLTIAPGILLHYNSADYFFVRKDRKDLAARIQQGLLTGIADGTRDKLRDSILKWPNIVRQLRIHERQVIELENPEFPADTPINEKNYWIDLKTSQRP